MVIIDRAPLGIMALDMKGRIRILNRMAAEILGINEDIYNIRGLNLNQHLDAIGILKGTLKKSLESGGTPINLEGIKYREHFLTICGRKIMNNYILTINNITRIKEIEAQSIMSMLEGQEIERKRLSKEIHDGLGPLLSTIKISLEAVKMELEKMHETRTLKSKLDNIYNLIDNLARDMRNISHSLMPKILDDFGVGPAVESLCNHLNDTEKIEVKYYNSGFEKRMNKSAELNLYRITQELINNALKHSEASQIIIQLVKHPESLLLMVEDNGKGFEKENVLPSQTGIGLKNIETRTKMLGGSFFIDSKVGKGVTATLEIPLKSLNNGQDKDTDC